MSEEQEYGLSFAQATQEYSVGEDVGIIEGMEAASRATQTPVQKFLEQARKVYPDNITLEERAEVEQAAAKIPNIENKNPEILMYSLLWKSRGLSISGDFQSFVRAYGLTKEQLDFLRYIRFVTKLKL
jgi:hypothetical protein